jgi:hypothetical protein
VRAAGDPHSHGADGSVVGARFKGAGAAWSPVYGPRVRRSMGPVEEPREQWR